MIGKLLQSGAPRNQQADFSFQGGGKCKRQDALASQFFEKKATLRRRRAKMRKHARIRAAKRPHTEGFFTV
jgi:hypothetical protein